MTKNDKMKRAVPTNKTNLEPVAHLTELERREARDLEIWHEQENKKKFAAAAQDSLQHSSARPRSSTIASYVAPAIPGDLLNSSETRRTNERLDIQADEKIKTPELTAIKDSLQQSSARPRSSTIASYVAAIPGNLLRSSKARRINWRLDRQADEKIKMMDLTEEPVVVCVDDTDKDSADFEEDMVIIDQEKLRVGLPKDLE